MRNRGFTLVEVMVVVVIIGILAAILLPALNAAIVAAKVAQTAVEEQNLATALAAFKNAYGEYPPSRIILWNLTKGTPTPYVLTDTTPVAPGDISRGFLNQRTVVAMQKYFTRARQFFPTSGTCQMDWTWGPNNPTILEGDECLLFFLCGLTYKLPSGDLTMTGFARDPYNPFSPMDPVNGIANRKGIMCELSNSRLVDLDGDGFASYVDVFSRNSGNPRPYAYFSAYGANAYDPNDCNSTEVDDAGVPMSRKFLVNFVAADKTRYVTSAAPNPYCLGDPCPSTAGSPTIWWNSQSFQILSAGRDGLYGYGGLWDEKATDRLPFGLPNDPKLSRNAEADNVANFSAGRLN